MNKQEVQRAAQMIQENIQVTPKIGLILGSGLGVLAEDIENPVKLKYADIPGFPVSTVEGHADQLVIGTIEGVPVVAMQGRFHYYEGYDLDEVTFPVRVMKELNVKTLIVTNAAGGVNPDFEPGDLMMITDHINNVGTNPLIGSNDPEIGVRFPDLTNAYDKELQQLVREAAKKLSLHLQEGVYVWNSGPTYETPAEIRMLQKIGADAVGMSTVPEVIVAVHSGMKVAGISCITNMAAGILDQPLSHDEVVETAEKAQENFVRLIKEMIASFSK